jgi:hypothetical protein
MEDKFYKITGSLMMFFGALSAIICLLYPPPGEISTNGMIITGVIIVCGLITLNLKWIRHITYKDFSIDVGTNNE